MSDAPHPPLNNGRWPRRAARITLLYVLLAILWFLVFDLVFDREALKTGISLVKGVLFVAVTAAGLYVLLHQGAQRSRDWSAALRSSQASREAFANASPDLMFELARDGTFLGYKAAPMGLNQPAEVFMGRRIQDVLPQIAPQTLEAIGRAFDTDKLQVFHYRLPYDGLLHEYEARVVTSGANSVVAIVRDVTEQRRIEDALHRAVRAYRLLSESNQIIVRATDEIALLNDICRVAVTSGQFRLAWVGYARDDAARTIEPVARYGNDDSYPASVRMTWADDPGGGCPAGRAIRSGQPVVIADCAADPAQAPWRDENLKRGYRSALALPLAADNRVFGVLSVYAGEIGAFQREEDIALLEELSRDLAHGISALRTRAERERARQAEREQRVLAEALSDTAIALNGSLDLEQVLDCILENIRGVVPHDTASILLIEGESVRMARHTGFRERGISAQIDGLRFDYRALEKYEIMRQTRQPVVIDDTAQSELWAPVSGTEWIRASVWAPIFYADEFIGVISLDSATPGFFTADHAGRLRAFAAQAAIAIRNARLFQAEHEQRSLAEALQDTATIINSALDLDAVTDHILDNLKRVLPHDSASLLLIEDGEAHAVRHRGFEERGLGEWLTGVRFPVAKFPTLRQMIDTCEPLIIANTATYPDWVTFPELAWIRSYAAAPIHREGRVIGYLQVESVQPDFFNAQHAEHLQSFADQAAIAIHNAQLYDAIQHHASDLEQRILERTAEVEAQRAQLQAVLDSMGEAVIFTRGGEVIYVNAAFSALLGYDPAELMHRPFDLIESLIAPAPEVERLRGAIRSGLTQNGSWRGTVGARRWDGATVDSALTITQVPGQEGTGDAGLVALFRDISQEKALQAQKDRFIAHASHELRTPLANIKTRLYLLRKQPDKLQAHLDVINRVTDSMTELIENLLDISRFERGVIPLYCQPVALADAIEEVIAIQQPEAERKDITLRASLPGQPLVTNADPQRISQVITNLVNNAINYTCEGGTITIELAPVDPRDNGSARQAAIRVRDTGIGIPVEMLSQVFEPFFRANEEVAAGTGLGLTIAREIVHLHHGSIEVDSAAGQGAVFTVTLDLLENGQERNNWAISD